MAIRKLVLYLDDVDLSYRTYLAYKILSCYKQFIHTMK